MARTPSTPSTPQTCITSIADLAVWESGRLQNGILADKWTYLDRYVGTKDQLIAAGFAKEEWFPTKESPGKKLGTIKRNFKPVEGVDLTQRQFGDKWELRLPIPKDEEERRRAEAECRHKKERATSEDVEREKSRPIPQTAHFAVGDKALFYKPGDDLHLRSAIIVEGYALHKVDDEKNAEQYGYIVAIAGDKSGQTWFIPAFRLREYAHKPFHVRLAVDNTKASM